jgi:putative ABC transport system permease protein
MSRARWWWVRFLALFRKNALDDDFADQAESHLAMAAEDHTRRGVSADEAARLAERAFGSVVASRDKHRDARGLPWLDELLFDLRSTLRGLRRDRGFTASVIIILAIAIGLNASVFTIVQAMIFRGLPLAKDSDRLAYIQVRRVGQSWGGSYSDFLQWREQARAFDGMAFFGGGQSATFRDGYGPSLDMLIRGATVNTFGLLGVRPSRGRDFTAADASPGAAPVAIISHEFWASRYGQRPDVIDSTVYIDDVPVTVVGVMPQRFALVYEQDIWVPVMPSAVADRRAPNGSVVGRLRDGVTVHSAQVEIETINSRLAALDPTTDREAVPLVLTYSEAHVAEDAPAIYGVLWAGALFVLLIACANVTNLALVRMLGRWRELSTRVALGAGQWRLLRQLLLESVLLATGAAAIGWGLTVWSVPRWAAATASPYVALDYTVGADAFAYLIAISVMAALLCAAAPAIRVQEFGAGAAVGRERGVTQSRRGRHITAGLIAGQLALAVILLASAGVLVRSLLNVVGADTGIGAQDRVMVGAVRLPPDKYTTPDARSAYFRELGDALRAIAGVEHASLANTLPVIGSGVPRRLEIEGQPDPGDARTPVQVLAVGPDYFRVLAARPTAGREFTERDDAQTAPVAIVNEQFARSFWPDAQAIGKRFRRAGAAGAWLTVVGVVPNLKQGDPIRQQFRPLVYVPFTQEPATRAMNSTMGCCFRGANFLVRTQVDPDLLAPALRVGLQAVDPDVVLDEMTPLTAMLAFNRDFTDLAHAELGKHAAIVPLYAAIALLLAAIGVYAVIAHSVRQRTNEIGVRMVIGATSWDIRHLVFREGMTPVVLGLAIGAGLSLAVNGLLRSQLVGVSPYDPVILATTPLVLVLVTLLACHIPLRRALRMEPATALRHD